MDKPDTTAWSKTICATTSNFFTRWTPCSCGWKTPCFGCNTDDLDIACSYIFPDTGLALRQTCQSGRWKSSDIRDTRTAWGNTACYPSPQESTAFCPAGTQVTGCGYVLQSFWGGTNAPDSFYPLANGTGCSLSVGGAPQACFKVWAACR